MRSKNLIELFFLYVFLISLIFIFLVVEIVDLTNHDQRVLLYICSLSFLDFCVLSQLHLFYWTSQNFTDLSMLYVLLNDGNKSSTRFLVFFVLPCGKFRFLLTKTTGK